MIVWSPRHFDRPVPRWIVPVHPAMSYMFQECRVLSRSSDDYLTSDRCRQCMGSPLPTGESGFLKRAKNCALWAEFPASSSKSWFCFSRRRGKRQLSKSWALCPRGAVKGTPAGGCRHLGVLSPDGSRMEAEAGKKCSSLTNTPSGRPRTKQKVQKK